MSLKTFVSSTRGPGLVDNGVEGGVGEGFVGEGNTLRPAMALEVSLVKEADERSSRQNWRNWC